MSGDHTEAISIFESVATLWHPSSEQTARFRSLASAVVSVDEESLINATVSGLSSKVAGGAIVGGVDDVSSQAAALAATPALLFGVWDCLAEAAEVTGCSVLARAVRRAVALESRVTTRRSLLLVALLEEVVTLRGQIQLHDKAPSLPSHRSSKPKPLFVAPVLQRQQSPAAAEPTGTDRRSALAFTLPASASAPAVSTPAPAPTPTPTPTPTLVATTTTTSPRAMPLRAVRDFLSALYASKARADARPASPWETLEGHLYVFLRHTVGLRSLMAAHARAFLSAVARYARIDTECLLAQRILRSECDEGFRRGAFAAVAEGAADALHAIMRSRTPNISPAALAAALTVRGVDVRVSGATAIPLAADEWRALPAALYADERDIATALASLEAAALRTAASAALGIALGYRESPAALLLADGADVDAAVSAEESVSAATAVLTQTEVRALLARDGAASLPWSTVLRELQLLAMERHARFLRSFITMWRSADVARTGTLSVGAFAALVERAAPAALPAARALVTEAAARGGVDITFSAAVAALSGSGSGGGGRGSGRRPDTQPALAPAPAHHETPGEVVAQVEAPAFVDFVDEFDMVKAAVAVVAPAVSLPPPPPPPYASSPVLRRSAPLQRAHRVSLLPRATHAIVAGDVAVAPSRVVVATRAGKVNYNYAR